VRCEGNVKATRCTVEDSGATGVYVGEQGSAEFVDCVIRKNGVHGEFVYSGTVVLRGGTISKNKHHGAFAYGSGKVTVAKAEEGKPQTVCRESGARNAVARSHGIPQEKNPHNILFKLCK